MKVLVRIGDGREVHVGEYNVKKGKMKIFCGSYQYISQHIDIVSGDVPTEENVTCILCVKSALRN